MEPILLCFFQCLQDKARGKSLPHQASGQSGPFPIVENRNRPSPGLPPEKPLCSLPFTKLSANLRDRACREPHVDPPLPEVEGDPAVSGEAADRKHPRPLPR